MTTNTINMNLEKKEEENKRKILLICIGKTIITTCS